MNQLKKYIEAIISKEVKNTVSIAKNINNVHENKLIRGITHNHSYNSRSVSKK